VLQQLKLEGDEQVGVNIITRAIKEPMRWIATNAGHEGSIVVRIGARHGRRRGFNAQTEPYENLVQAG
jgi:chaperonin GroEL